MAALRLGDTPEQEPEREPQAPSRMPGPPASLAPAPRFRRGALLVAPGLVLLVLAAIVFGMRARGSERCAARVEGVCLSRPEHTFYLANTAWLGTVVGRAMVDGQPHLFFTYAAVTHNPAPAVRGTSAEWALLDLGRRDALRRGLTLAPDTPTDPVVQAWLDAQTRHGVPWRERLGRFPITEPFCGTGPVGGPVECVQHFANAVVRFRPTGQVTLDPLGAQAVGWYAGRSDR